MFSCADISIASQENNIFLSNPTPISQNPVLSYPFYNPVVYSSTRIPPSIFIYPEVTFPTRTTVSMDFIYPFRLSEESITKDKTLRCYSTNEALKPLIGIENWCLQLCAINCPPTLCICVKI